MLKIAINGFGRIGRVAFRVWLSRPDLQQNLDLVAINTSGSMPASGWTHLLRYDTAYGPLKNQISSKDTKDPKEASDADPLIGHITVDDKSFPVLAQRDPVKIPWSDYGVDLVLEATGVFRTQDSAGAHLRAGAKKVLITAPPKGGNIGTYVLGANTYQGEHTVADNASCTTNCVAPIAAIIHSKFSIKKAALTTIHGYTDDQKLQDGSHKDWRRARAAAANIIPTTTGAAKATAKTIPELEGLFDGVAMRVPVITGSMSDLTFLVGKQTTVEEINQAFIEATTKPLWRGIVATTTDPLVSADIIGRPESAIVDLSLTQVIAGDLVKIFAWYDNEWGYCNRLLEQAIQVGSQ